MSTGNQAQNYKNALQSKQDSSKPDHPESPLWRGVYSAKEMFGSLLVAALITIAAGVAIGMVPFLRDSMPLWIISGVILAMWAYLLGLMAYRKLSKSYELTTQRLKHRDGFLMRTMNRIELIDIDDVTFKQGPIETLLNVGNIEVKSSDVSHPVLFLRGISDVRKIADMIDDARRSERRRRTVHVENV